MSDVHADTHIHDALPHAVPVRVLLTVFALLMLFTFITVAVTWIDLGSFNVWLALLIAVVKAALVALYFMHLRWDSPINGIVLILGFAFVALFIGVTLIDARAYQENYTPPQSSRLAP